MGKINQGILGGVSGKVGSVVGASWKGIPTVRVHQPIVSNPQTADQTAQRDGFKFVTKIASSILSSIIKNFWDRFAVKMSGYNSFIQAQKAVGGGFVSTMSAIIFSSGKMGSTDLTSAESAGSSVTLTWPTSLTDRYALATDILGVVLYDETNKVAFGYSNTSKVRSAGTVTITAADLGINTEDFALTDMKALIFFRRADGSVVSNQSAAKAIEAE